MTVMCNGSLALGTGCGVCSRCVEESGVDDAWITQFYPGISTAAERAQVRKDIVAIREKVRAQAVDPDAAFNRPAGAKWGIGDYVAKKRGSKWRGRVVGFYSTDVTRIGYCVESFFAVGSVQVWPGDALVGWEPLAGVPEPTEEPSLFNARIEVSSEQPVRKRKPQDATLWPPSMTAEQIENSIDDLCGCVGRFGCDCIAVFNKARQSAWYLHNTTGSGNA